MHHGDLGPERLREGAGLPMGRRDGRIGEIKMHIVVEVLEPEAAVVSRHILDRKLGVEPGIRALSQIEELAEDAQLGLRPDLFQKQAFPPPGMGDDRIGSETLFLELEAGPKRPLGPDDFGLEINHPRMRAGR